jgi:MATE family multidrug resistance protein
MQTKPTFWQETRTLLVLAAPLTISQLAQMGMNFTDTVMAGRHAETSLAGVAIGSSIWVPCFLLLVGIMLATTPLVAQAWGAKDHGRIKLTVQQSMWLALIVGFVMLLFLQSLRFIFNFMEMDAVAREQAHGYVFGVSFSLPALAVFQVLRGLNEGLHFTRPYMYVSLVAVLLNIPLNFLFVYGLFGLPEMGGAGCGWATTVVMWLELLALWVLSRKNKALSKFNWHIDWPRPDWQEVLSIFKLGFPIGIALLVESSMFALIALFLAELGSTVVAGHQVAMSFISLLFMIPLSIAMALTIRCGFYLGEGKPDFARFVGLIGIGFTLITALFFSILMVTIGHPIAGFYTHNAEVQMIAAQLLLLAAIFQFSDAVQVTAAGALRGYKDTRTAFIVVVLAYWVIGLPLGYSLGLTDMWGQQYGAQGFWMGLVVGLAIAAILLGWRFLHLSRQQVQSKQQDATTNVYSN